MNQARYIVVEGPIGAGKTTLTHLLCEHFGGMTLLEDPDANPFLSGFYKDPQRYALSTQLFFLFQRVNQVRDLKQRNLFEQAVIADFMLDKDALFANLNLNDDELRLYQEIFDHVKLQAPLPDLIVYLQAPVEVLIERIRRRGNSYEANISHEYLVRLAESYSRFFHQYDRAPVLIVNSGNLNFVEQREHLDLLLEHIGNMRGVREFFNLGG